MSTSITRELFARGPSLVASMGPGLVAVVGELRALGMKVQCPAATFYAWADVSGLPAPLNDGVGFFEHCLEVCAGGPDMWPLSIGRLVSAATNWTAASVKSIHRGLEGQ